MGYIVRPCPPNQTIGGKLCANPTFCLKFYLQQGLCIAAVLRAWSEALTGTVGLQEQKGGPLLHPEE